MVKVIVDTSFLMLPGTLKIDVLRETERLLERRCEFLVPSPVLDELKKIAEGGSPREKSAARLALKIVEKCKVVEAEGEADSSILSLAEEMKVPVGTADGGLRRELRKRRVSVIYPRGKSHLAIDGSGEWIK
ncbi:MAG: PIN domain-containing protein [Candidatus Hadarchaeales archaeon]